jgi:hypothetical protein
MFFLNGFSCHRQQAWGVDPTMLKSRWAECGMGQML